MFVVLLQYADLYDVQKLIRYTNDCMRLVNQLMELNIMNARYHQASIDFMKLNTELVRIL